MNRIPKDANLVRAKMSSMAKRIQEAKDRDGPSPSAGFSNAHARIQESQVMISPFAPKAPPLLQNRVFSLGICVESCYKQTPIIMRAFNPPLSVNIRLMFRPLLLIFFLVR